MLWSKWSIRFGWEREKNIVLLRTEGTYTQKTDRMPEPAVHESPSLPSGGKKHCYDEDGFLFLHTHTSPHTPVLCLLSLSSMGGFFSFSSSSLFQLLKTYTHAFLLVLPLLLSVPFLLLLLTPHIVRMEE